MTFTACGLAEKSDKMVSPPDEDHKKKKKESWTRYDSGCHARNTSFRQLEIEEKRRLESFPYCPGKIERYFE